MNHAGDGFDGLPVETLIGTWGIGEGPRTPPRKSLAIVGSHPATRQLAPYEDPNFEIWLFNEAPQKPEVYRRWDASFQMHLPEVYASEHNWVNQDHWVWLQQDHGDKTIWMQEVDPRVPNSRRYPIEGVLSLVPYRYMRSTPAMALALAIYLGYQHIQLYGSELSSNTEYGYQAINYAFWIGFAHGYGVNLELKCWQAEFTQPLYGYDGELQVPRDFYELRINDAKTYVRSKRKAYQRVESKLQDALLSGNAPKVASLSLNVENLALELGEAEGALSEASRYAERENPISRQEFERVAAQAQIDAQKAHDLLKHEAGKCEYVWNVWRTHGNYNALKQLREFLKAKTEYALDEGRQTGIMRENLQYLAEYDQLVTAAGGQRAVSQAEKLIVGG